MLIAFIHPAWMSIVIRLALLLLLCGLPLIAPAQSVAPNYAGTPTLNVDITDLDHRLFRVRESIPVSPGPLKLWYPQWLPGNHAPRGPIEAIGGLLITGNGQRIEWMRDPVDVYTFHLTVPEGVTNLDLRFDYATPFAREQSRIVATPEMAGVQWNTVLLYPASASMDGIRVQANLKLPPEWDAASALEELTRTGDLVSYEPTSLETLVDSPVFAGRNLRRVPLGSTGGAKVALNIVADTVGALGATTPQLEMHAKLVREAEIGRAHV
jgi:predicted metalloprotease with PDZ domain